VQHRFRQLTRHVIIMRRTPPSRAGTPAELVRRTRETAGASPHRRAFTPRAPPAPFPHLPEHEVELYGPAAACRPRHADRVAHVTQQRRRRHLPARARHVLHPDRGTQRGSANHIVMRIRAIAENSGATHHHRPVISPLPHSCQRVWPVWSSIRHHPLHPNHQTSTYQRAKGPKMPGCAMVWLAPQSRCSGGRSAVSSTMGRHSSDASTTAGN
jgi:hypothetical protein